MEPDATSADFRSRALPRRARPRLLRLAALLPAFVAAACVTVNIYFPAPEVREAAERIVEETWGEGGTPPPSSSLPARALFAALSVFSPAEAHAGDVDIDVSTAAIRAIKDAMKQRSAELRPLLDAGSVGIGSDGMLVLREAEGLDLATKAKARRLVDAENKDRESLYREIASANDFGSERVADIRSIFAATWKEKAEGGWWIQAANGTWGRR